MKGTVMRMISRARHRDIILILTVIAIAGVMAFFFWRDTRAGVGGGRHIVSVGVDGAVWRETPLGVDSRVEVDVDGRLNVVVIEDGGVRMEDADCPDKLCVRQGEIRDGRIPIVCLPNRVTVRILEADGGAPADADVDAVAG